MGIYIVLTETLQFNSNRGGLPWVFTLFSQLIQES